MSSNNASTRTRYQGNSRKLVIAFDVGTTFSGISYAILEPGRTLLLKDDAMYRFPGQENVGGDCKIPTIMYYDNAGQLRAAGAEAKDQGIEEKAAEEDWVKAEWFKLHLRPNTTATIHLAKVLPPLPPGKTAITLFADFLRYLHSCARSYIEERHAKGGEFWQMLQPEAHYILTHPNGWEGAQQSQMRRAAVLAGLITDDILGHSRLSFLTEGEASLHFCVGSELTAESCKSGKGILIIDAGGGTIDISAYKYVPRSGYEETTVPQCRRFCSCFVIQGTLKINLGHLQGSVMVTTRVERFLSTVLKGSRFSNDVKYIAQCFDKSTKHVFRSVDDFQYIRFGSPNDRDEEYNIRRGQLKLTGAEVAECFAPSVECIIKAIETMKNTISADIQSVFLVGGFAANSYLFNKVKSQFAPKGIDVSRPDPNRVNKAIADGAISFYLDGFVTSRMAKFDYGQEIYVDYLASKESHRSRSGKVEVDCVGRAILVGAFDKILTKGTKVTEADEFRCAYHRTALTKDELAEINTEIICYRGNLRDVEWFDEDPDLFHTLCSVKADASSMSKSLKMKKKRVDGTSIKYYQLYYDVVLTLGKTEFKAHLEWKENGVTRSTPATLIYDADEVIPAPPVETAAGHDA
ncbi:hypothetical protein BJ165DRAFT_1387797 [Panaeolus papilionaceus]|nr:hypothetical protein BJ165DRAFT_1387797 [Panaeolus papilionaceus]